VRGMCGWWRWKFASFYEGNVERIKDVISSRVPKAISLRVRGITDKDTRKGTMKNLRVGSRN